MKRWLADLHVHTLLSPCGSLEMSPVQIVETAINKGLDLIGIADHNTTRQCCEIARLGKTKGLAVICGAEVTTSEEVHCLAFFENFEKLEAFQVFLDEHLPNIPNVPDMFGDQVWVDDKEMIQGEESRLLISAISKSIDEVADKVHELGGLFIPAHIDRQGFGIIHQLGFLPEGLKMDAVEIVGFTSAETAREKYGLSENVAIVTSSDAHVPDQIGRRSTVFEIETATFSELAMALKGVNGRRILSNNVE